MYQGPSPSVTQKLSSTPQGWNCTQQTSPISLPITHHHDKSLHLSCSSDNKSTGTCPRPFETSVLY